MGSFLFSRSRFCVTNCGIYVVKRGKEQMEQKATE